MGIYPIDTESGLSIPIEDKSAEQAMASEVQTEDESMEPDERVSEPVAVAGPFTDYSDELDFPDPREAPISNICTALREIIERDGPLTRLSIYHLYIEGCPYLQRSGRAVRDKLDFALRTILKAGEIIQEDELGAKKSEGLVVRMAGTPAVRLRPAGRRKIEEIPPSEVFLIIDRMQFSESVTESYDEELLFRKILEHFGYSQLTRTRKKHLQNLLNRFRQKEKDNQPDQETPAGGRPVPGSLFSLGPLYEKE